MNPPDLSRLHSLRMKNDATGYAMEEMRPRFEALRTRHEDGTAPRALAASQLFQTPAALAARMVELAEPRPGLAWLEPSAGLGRLLRPILATNPATNPASVTACEVDTALCGELFREFPEVKLQQGDFLQKQCGQFDRIVMNPPFTMRSDIRHIEHAVAHLAPGGVLVGLCLATHHRETALRSRCDHWETIPAGTFSKEGTNVETILFRITR